jgi:FkbM family methyltransferase
MQLLRRIRRKLSDVLCYPRLAWQARDLRELWVLALVQNRIPCSGVAVFALTNRGKVITPRLTLTHGQRIRVQLSESGQRDVFGELFLARIYDLGLVPFTPGLVVDCGAYCGYFSAMAAGTFPGAEVVCFEANPSHLPMLEAQLSLLDKKVELHAEAVHVRDGAVRFSGSGTGGGITFAEETGESRDVPCIDFPRWLASREPASLVLKMDVEGAELELLPALLATLPRNTVCYLETHFAEATCETLLAPYRSAGFAVREIRRREAVGKGFNYIEWVLARSA